MPVTHIPRGNLIDVAFTLVEMEALLGENLTGYHDPSYESARAKLREAHAALLHSLAYPRTDADA